MATRVTDRQLRLLRRIVDGVDPPAGGEASSVYALRARGLVTTCSPYAYRTAAATDAGRALISEPEPRGDAREAPPRDRQGVVAGAPASMEMLIELLHQDDAMLTVADPAPGVRAAWRRLLFRAQGHPAVPDGMTVRHRGRNAGDLTVWLEITIPESSPTPPVVIPDRVRGAHPLVAALRDVRGDRDGWIDTSRDPEIAHVRVQRAHRDRVVRLLHALTSEALRRGYTVDSRSGCDGHGGLNIEIGGHGFEVTVVEATRRVPHELTPDEQARRDRDGDAWAPRWDFVPSGQLTLRVGHGSYTTTLAADRQRWRLEDRLTQALGRLEALAHEAEERRLESLRREQQRQREWEAAMVNARERYADARRVEHLLGQVGRWEQAVRIRAFVAAQTAHEDPDTRGWLVWAARYADSIDPSGHPVAGPTPADPSPSDLAPYLSGWSPYGPTQSRSW